MKKFITYYFSSTRVFLNESSIADPKYVYFLVDYSLVFVALNPVHTCTLTPGFEKYLFIWLKTKSGPKIIHFQEVMIHVNSPNWCNHTLTCPQGSFSEILYDVIQFLSVGYPPESIGNGTPSENVLHAHRYHRGKFGALFHPVTI